MQVMAIFGLVGAALAVRAPLSCPTDTYLLSCVQPQQLNIKLTHQTF